MKAILSAAALSLATALPSLAFDPAAMTDAEKEAFGTAVRDYLMANPEVLIESINVLETRRAAEAVQNDLVLVENNKDAIFNDGHSWVGGNPEGDITLVEFVDYRCGFCRKVNPELEALIKDDGNIRFILKEFPILGEESDLASRFAVSVQQLTDGNTYKQIHDQLMAMRGPVNLESLTEMATAAKLDAPAIINRMNTEEVSAVLRENRQLAERMGIQGTPTFIIGPEMLRGVPQTGLAAAVAEIRKKVEG
ncbi:DsbA family protein [Paracoccus sulfuroxidans]|uniref:Protein-disulfide isomerase n=1 Tax=Paracoccus sulfuroxidans TaxID=384678 RepID=A0A562NX05_9RHOB|nr:DsbA family protein [Paracoccus sulfuroxidans]TWI36757.1 protein-disulfide isomerase [Paracoccus sulfuroxidans]